MLRWPKATLPIAVLALATTAWPLLRLGGEFLPPLDEGDLLYMPSALPGLSAQKAGELLQQTDRMIKTVPEVERVFGKAGRAETATDPAPLEMFETTIQLKPRDAVARRHDAGEAGRRTRPRGAGAGADQHLGAADPQPHRHAGHRHQEPDRRQGHRRPTWRRSTASRSAIERVAKGVPGVSSALAERLTGGRYIDVEIDRAAAARYGLNIADVQAVVAGAIGGENVGETVEGRARFPINLRYPREWRDTPERLAEPCRSSRRWASRSRSARWPAVAVSDGPPMLKSENARPSGWVYVDVRGRDLAVGGGRPARRGGDGGQARTRHEPGLLGAVRVPGARQRAAEAGRAGDAADHLRAAVPDLQPRRRGRC